jgi:NADPH:quinone reductase-like Zn-dependent oxidoreductase
MKRRYRILASIAAVFVLGVVALDLVVGHNGPCAKSPALPEGAVRMKAVMQRCYGPSSLHTVESVAKPAPADDELLVRVHAASINPLDWHYARGAPTIMRFDIGIGQPKDPRAGADFAGTVEAVGRNVTEFRTGDEVFGVRNGALGQYLTVRESRAVALKPANVPFEQAAAVPIAGVTALQALRDTAHVHLGQSVLINGASGGVGTFVVQIGKILGAHVTGVCSTKNVDLVREIGADRVIDYTREDYTRGADRYDVILDTVGNRPFLESRRVLKPEGTLIAIGGGGRQETGMIGPLLTPIRGYLLFLFSKQKFETFLSDDKKEDLVYLGTLMQSGKLTPVIGRRYTLDETAAALTYLEGGHARGKGGHSGRLVSYAFVLVPP